MALMASFYYFQYFSGELSPAVVLARNMNCGVLALGDCPACVRLMGSSKGSWSAGQDLAGPMENSVIWVSQLSPRGDTSSCSPGLILRGSLEQV